jgi:exosortase
MSKIKSIYIRQDYTAILLVLITFALVIALYFPILRQIAILCWNNDDYSHGLILPLVTLYLLWDQKDKINLHSSRGVSFSFIGLFLLVVSVSTYIIILSAQSLFASWVLFFITLIGTMNLLFGYTNAKPLILPVLINFMARPLPESFVPKLFYPFQVYAAKISAWVLSALDVPIYLSGNIIEIPGMRLLVEEACSGMRSMMALLTVALIIVYLFKRPFIAQVLIVILSVIIAIVLNVFRVTLTGVLAHFYDPKSATGFFHSFSGLVVFILGLLILYWISLMLNKFSWTKVR